MRKNIAVIIFSLLIMSGCSSSPIVQEKPKTIDINGQTWTVELADTMEKQTTGLSGRDSLTPMTGLYFTFSQAEERTFWMKNMKFPIDIIWIKGDEIVRVDYDALPEGNDPQNFYMSKEAVDRVLEINNGEAMKYNIKAGDKVKFNEQ